MGIISRWGGIIVRDRGIFTGPSSLADMNVSSQALVRALVATQVATLGQIHHVSTLRADVVTVNSNLTQAPVSTTAVKSDSVILATILTTVASVQQMRVGVGSRVDGVSFAVYVAPAIASEAVQVFWKIER